MTVALKKVAKPKVTETPVVAFSDAAAWLVSHHGSSRGLWLKIAKKGSVTASVILAQGQASPYGIAASTSAIYWTDRTEGR